jgi:hypothetical protein
MDVETTISNFVERQFPKFYDAEGVDFMLFVRAYYEWLEGANEAIGLARRLPTFRDVDSSPDAFLKHFQEKYLYGIPFSVITNKRLLLKHIQDIYRTKGTDKCYHLLFKLIYGQDVEIYKPRDDVLKASDGTWIEPRYVEVTDSAIARSLIGKQVIGAISNTIATVESYSLEPISDTVVGVMGLSNILPDGGDLIVGESLLDLANTASFDLDMAPRVTGSMIGLDVLSGGSDFLVGDILAIPTIDPITDKITHGAGGKVKVVSTVKSFGQLQFDIVDGGDGYTSNATVFFYEYPYDLTAVGAGFKNGPVSSVRNLTYCTDLLIDYANVQLNAASFGLPGNASANVSTALIDSLSFTNGQFGSIYSLTNISPGIGYQYQPDILLRSSQLSGALPGSVSFSSEIHGGASPGTISYDTSSNVVTGNGTSFTTKFSNDDVIFLHANPSIANTRDYIRILEVANDTSMTLYERPTSNSGPVSLYQRGYGVSGTNTVFADVFSSNSSVSFRANSSSNAVTCLVRRVVNNQFMILYGPPSFDSTGNTTYHLAPSIVGANFATYEEAMATDSGVSGENGVVIGIPLSTGNVVSRVVAYDSGRSYVDSDTVSAYLFSGITTPEIVNGGVGYSNGAPLLFVGGSTTRHANGFVTTDSNGTIVSVTMVDEGANYDEIPQILISGQGNGAILTTAINPPDKLNMHSYVTGRIIKGGIGRGPGRWTTTRSFLNADKYVHDSEYYQEFSYEIRVANALRVYRDVIYDTFHSSGMELFGRYLSIDVVSHDSVLAYETT